jgi:hypothetical protein
MLMATSSNRKKINLAQKAQYAPKPKAAPPQPQARPIEKHLVSDMMLKKIIQRVLAELKLPGKIPSEVLYTALAEVRDLTEQAKNKR